jgi:hypothetical protein
LCSEKYTWTFTNNDALFSINAPQSPTKHSARQNKAKNEKNKLRNIF